MSWLHLLVGLLKVSSLGHLLADGEGVEDGCPQAENAHEVSQASPVSMPGCWCCRLLLRWAAFGLRPLTVSKEEKLMGVSCRVKPGP